MALANRMASLYDENREITRYVHSTSRGHEAIQLAAAFQLKPWDYASLYYRDESLLIGLGFSPYELMLQLLGKAEDPFSGGRLYYSHPSVRREDMPLIPHQSSATGMQAISATGMAQGIAYLEKQGLLQAKEPPVVLCSLGDGSVTEGEVAEAWQFAVLHRLPIIYLVQDNGWGISVTAGEARAMDAYEYAAGFKGMKRMRVDGSLFPESWNTMQEAFDYVRTKRKPVLVHARVPLLGHHTSGVRKEWYRSPEDLERHQKDDPLPKLYQLLRSTGVPESELQALQTQAKNQAEEDFQRAVKAPDPPPESLYDHEFAPTPVTHEAGQRNGGGEPVVMVDAALHAMDEILAEYPEAIFFGQDVGKRLGGVFREAATLGDKYGDERVFNTAIQEAYIIGSTAGLSAVGVKPIVELQFADYIWPGINQLVTELAKSCYLTAGKFPVQALIRIPTGAYGGGGPYHSASVESSLLPIRGLKIVYPSNAADMKGLMKAAFLDPNPVIMLEHKGLYWSRVPGTREARMPDPGRDYIIPLGKANTVQQADKEKTGNGETLCVITYGMGVHWTRNASKDFPGQVEIVDLRTLNPLDEELVYESVRRHGKCLVLTEDTWLNSFAESLAGRISRECFTGLDAPVEVLGSENVPAVPLNIQLENTMLPGVKKTREAIQKLLEY